MDLEYWGTALLYILFSICCVVPVAFTLGSIVFATLNDLVYYALNLPKDEEE